VCVCVCVMYIQEYKLLMINQGETHLH